MKRFFFIATAILLSMMAVAKTYYVEKAYQVKVKGQKELLQPGTIIDANKKISVPKNGVLVFVDRETGNRWLVKKEYNGKIGKIARPVEKNMWTVTKSYFYTFTRSESTSGEVAGYVERDVHSDSDIRKKESPDSLKLFDPSYKMDFSVATTPDSISCYIIE